MSERPESNQNEPRDTPSYTPASPVKRVLAWVGVIYMVALVFLNLYPFFQGGSYLTGVAPLFLCPGAAGLGVLAVLTLRDKDCLPSKKVSMAMLAVACALVFVLGLVKGIPPLLAGLGVS